jgi:parallel beta-helix repeat protein
MGRMRRFSGFAALVVAAAILLVPVSAAATGVVYYVDNTRSCSDSGPGTADQPFCTIKAGAQHAGAGDTVQVVAGTYAGPVTPQTSGTAGSPLTFAAAPGVTISGGTNGFAISSKSYVTVQGFKITGTTSYGISVSGSSNITIGGNTVTYSGQPVSGKIAAGIKLSNVTASTVTGNTADHNSDSGMYLASGTSGVTVAGNEASWNAEGYQRNANGINVISSGNFIIGNVLHDNEDSGIQFYPGGNNNLAAANVTYNNGDHGIDNYNVTGGRMIGNTVYHNCTTGINVEGTSGNYVVENNVAVDNAVYPAYKGISCSRRAGNIGIWDSAPATTTSDYNLVWLTTSGKTYVWAGTTYNSLSALQAASGQEAHGIFADPQFVSPSNWNLQLLEGSPAIDSANSAVSGEQPTDVLGAPRVDDPATANTGAGPRSYDDRGAYEFQPTGVPTTTSSTTTTSTSSTTSTTSTTIPQTTTTTSSTSTSTSTTSTSTSTTSTTTSSTSTTTTSTTLPGGSTNLVTNGGFETDLSGWSPYPSSSISLVRVSPGHSGNWAVEVRNTSSSTIPYCTLNDSPNWVTTTLAGTYTAAAWVRADTAGATVRLTLSEYAGSTKVGSAAAILTLSTSWQSISATYTPVSPGSTLDFNLYTKDSPPGQCLQADDVSETLG